MTTQGSETELLSSYHGVLTKELASDILRGSKPGTFIFGIENTSQFIYPRYLLFVVVVEANTENDDSKNKSEKENERKKENEETKVKSFCVEDRYLSVVDGYSSESSKNKILYPSLYELVQSEFGDIFQHPLPCKERVSFFPDLDQAAAGSVLYSSLFQHILHFVDAKTLCICASVCKLFLSLSKDDNMWEKLYRDRFSFWVPDSFLQRGDLPWKLKYMFEHSLLDSQETYVFDNKWDRPFISSMAESYYPQFRYHHTLPDTIRVIRYDMDDELEAKRVAFPNVGYLIDSNIHPTLNAYVKFLFSKLTHLASDGMLKMLQRLMLHPKCDLLHFHHDNTLSTNELRFLMSPNTKVRVLSLGDLENIYYYGPSLAELLGVMTTLLSRDLGPLEKLKLKPFQSSASGELRKWLQKVTCPLKMVVAYITERNEPVDPITRLMRAFEKNKGVKKLKLRMEKLDSRDLMQGLVSAKHVPKIVVVVYSPEQPLPEGASEYPNLTIRFKEKKLVK